MKQPPYPSFAVTTLSASQVPNTPKDVDLAINHTPDATNDWDVGEYGKSPTQADSGHLLQLEQKAAQRELRLLRQPLLRLAG